MTPSSSAPRKAALQPDLRQHLESQHRHNTAQTENGEMQEDISVCVWRSNILCGMESGQARLLREGGKSGPVRGTAQGHAERIPAVSI